MSLQLHDYQICEQIGKGSFATVYRAYHKITNQTVAIKTIDLHSYLNEPGAEQFLDSELSISRKVSHPLIAQTFEVIHEKSRVSIVMELMEGGSLLDLINKLDPALPEELARKYFRQLVYAIMYLHNEVHIVHRDLKAENILLDKFGNIRIVDFGLSKQTSDIMCTLCGSPAYAAPELILSLPYSNKVDIWSLGVILYAMVHGRLPFNHENYQRLTTQIIRDEPEYNHSLSPSLIDLLQKLLTKNPKDRISLDEIENHPWFITGADYNPEVFSNPEFFENTIDPEIVNDITRLGLNARNLALLLDSDVEAREKTCYKILRRKKVTIEFEKALKSCKGSLKKETHVTASLPALYSISQPPVRVAAINLKSTTDASRRVGSLPSKSIQLPTTRFRQPAPINDSPLVGTVRRRTRALTSVGVTDIISSKLPFLPHHY